MSFQGQYHDAETDLFQNWNRFCDPAIGWYLEPEPAAGQLAVSIDHGDIPNIILNPSVPVAPLQR